MLQQILKYSFFILFACSFFACEKAEKLKSPGFTVPSINATDISLTVVKDNVIADGVQYNEFLLKVNNAIKANFKEAAFEISPVGKFSTGTTSQKVPIDINGEARVFASSTTAGPATVRATVGDYSSQVTTLFSVSWPDQLVVEADSAFLPAMPGMKTNVRARLLKAQGSVSTGLPVTFYDSTAIANPASVGIFFNTTLSNASGVANSEYALQDTSYHNYVYLKAYVATPAGKVTGMTRILIRK